jgi:hypothetical protein
MTVSSVCEHLYAASTGLDCYEEDGYVGQFEAEITALLNTCPEATLQAYAACLVGEDNPTVCAADGSLTANTGVCVTELDAVLACSGSSIDSAIEQ